MPFGYNGDIFLSQSAFIRDMLHKHEATKQKGIAAISIDKLPSDPDPPAPKELKELQEGVKNVSWAKTETRIEAALLGSI